MQLLTERLFLIPLQPDGMRALLARTTDPELVGPYTEMLTLSLRHPEQWFWYTAWGLYQNDSGDFVGDLCFKGLPKNGQPEIGYGISPEFQGQGYATEAIRAACRWALAQPGVAAVEAETEPANAASQAVLRKVGFVPTGTVGKEGPRFILRPLPACAQLFRHSPLHLPQLVP